MARAGVVVQVERLRDQVYRLIRDDLKAGVLKPGQRIVEGELAERYRVSRTPVREALFQLARDGRLETGGERGYVVAVDSPQSTAYRHEVRDILDPQLAHHAALEGAPEQRRALLKAHDRQAAAHAAGKLPAFIAANVDFRATLRAMCRNALLAKCSEIVDDQAQWARRTAFGEPLNRQLEVEASALLCTAVVAGDAAGARRAMADYIASVRSPLAALAAD